MCAPYTLNLKAPNPKTIQVVGILGFGEVLGK